MKVYKKKKSKYLDKDAKLPSNYSELFFDSIKQNWRTIILCGLMFLFFLLPALAVLFFKDLYISSLLSSTDYTLEEIDALKITANNIFNIGLSLGIVIAGIGLSGLSRIFLLLAREEEVFFFKDFNKGIKQNIKNNFVFFLIYALLIYLSLMVMNNLKTEFVTYVPFGLVQAIFFPLLIINLATTSIYTWTVKNSFLNSFFIYIKNFYIVLPYSILLTAILFLNFIPYIFLRYILIALIVVLVYPFISLGFKVYMNKILDRDINKEHYPEIYKKGIYEDNTPSPIEELVSSYYGVNSTYKDLRNDPYLDMYFQHLCSYLPPKAKLKELRLCHHGNEERMAIVDALNHLRSLVLDQQVSYLYKRHYSVLGLRQKERRKVAIVMGGGGYEYVSTLPEEFPISTELHKKGLNVFSLVYPIKEDSKYANGVLKEFIHFLFKHKEKMNIDMEDYMVVGFSASGHLAASIATDNLGLVDVPKPKLIGLAYPVISMGECTHVGSRENLLGKDSTQEERDEHSVELHVGKDFSSCFIWHLEGDITVSSKNSLLLVEALKKQNIDYRLELFEGIEHGLGLGQNTVAENWLERLYQYYQELTEPK